MSINDLKKTEKIVNHLKQTGFVFQGSQIYGGLANTWDYGHIGVLLKENIIQLWKKYFVNHNENVFLLDAKILMNPQVWKTSGHTSNFSDPLIENTINKKRYRADLIIEKINPELNTDKMSNLEMEAWIKKNVKKYDGSKTIWNEIKNFNLMFETSQGVVENKKNLIYLRPETAQAIFINFKNYTRFYKATLPFGVAQIGKAFRNEITPSNFMFRTREFEQMELEFFVDPKYNQKEFEQLVELNYHFAKYVGLNKNKIRKVSHSKKQLSHYSKATTDIEYQFSFGWGELMGIANRGDFDLAIHSKISNENLIYHDAKTNKNFYPHVIEPSIGLDRLMYAILDDAFVEQKLNQKDIRTILQINKKIVPYQIAVLPLTQKLNLEARQIFKTLLKANYRVIFDQTASIGKRYRRQDAIGTYFCLTYDFDSSNDQQVTIRNRDTMKQIRISTNKLENYLRKEFNE